MKLIDADKLMERIEQSILNDYNTGDSEKDEAAQGALAYARTLIEQAPTVAAAEIEALELVKTTIDEMKQEKPTPPGVEEESQRKGWLDYGQMMGEIGLHRYNAIRRIKEHKEQFCPQAVPDLYHVAEYYKSVGAELTCCCLQAYGKDFIFTQDEVKEFINKED